MREEPVGRKWQVIRTIKASPNGLTATKIAQREETGIRTIYRNLELLQAAGFPYPCHHQNLVMPCQNTIKKAR